MPRAPLAFALMLCVGLCADGQDSTDPVFQKLERAKAKYEQARTQYREAVRVALDDKEKAARSAGNKKLLDQVVAEREAFKQTEEHPTSVAKLPLTRLESSRREREAVFESAIKELTKAGRDLSATEVENQLRAFRLSETLVWQHQSGATAQDGYLRIQKEGILPTKAEFTGPVEITLVARTERENIRLYAHRGAGVIFNWEVNPKQLRVTRPDGTTKYESGSLATAAVTPLEPNTWYTIRWQLTAQGMRVSVDDKVVFAEQKSYDLSTPTRIAIKSGKSLVDVKDFSVAPVKAK